VSRVEHELSADVVVGGGGAAGIGAAIGAAEQGARTVLLERYGFLGGLATTAIVGTVCGLYLRSEGALAWANEGLPRRVGEALVTRGAEPASWRDGLRFLPYDPLAFRLLADDLVDDAGVVTHLHTTVSDVRTEGRRIRSLRAIAWDRAVELRADAFVDCTGHALLTALTGGELADAKLHQAPPFVFSLEGLRPMPSFNLRMTVLKAVRQAVQAGALPHDAECLSVVPGTHRDGFARFKLGLRRRLEPELDALTPVEARARHLVRDIHRELVRTAPGFEGSRVTDLASQLGVRSGRRPVGRAVLGDDDVLQDRRHPEGITRGAWPVELWSDDHKPELRHFEMGATYDVPAGCLESASLDNLWFAGRHLSATDLAIASARVIGTCLGTGYAAGVLASHAIQGRTRAASIQAVRDVLMGS
jgi:hypothetical protein